jgi:5'-deoxynucleotidase YfbR-like HD superfamily hydrolase
MRKLYRSGLVQRYHSNPDLARFGQTNAQHQWGVAVLVLALHPRPSKNLIIAAVLHDVGEIDAGDLSRPFKREHPEFAAAHRSIEESFRDETIGVNLASSFGGLTPTEKDWLKLCDNLESYLFALTFNRSVTETQHWIDYQELILSSAENLGCFESVKELLK